MKCFLLPPRYPWVVDPPTPPVPPSFPCPSRQLSPLLTPVRGTSKECFSSSIKFSYFKFYIQLFHHDRNIGQAWQASLFVGNHFSRVRVYNRHFSFIDNYSNRNRRASRGISYASGSNGFPSHKRYSSLSGSSGSLNTFNISRYPGAPPQSSGGQCRCPSRKTG